ncbi:MAG TPA: transporter substrate-binding protein [Planctomicrobium sp.]|nr:transporter substrate-binding protein [Planctomicrobium sp.]
MTGTSDPTNPDQNSQPQVTSDPSQETCIQGHETTPPILPPVTRSMNATQKWIGKLIGKYRVTGVIGRGGMGVVLRGHDDVIDRDVAIKVLPEDLSEDTVSLNRFLAEARTTGRLNHPNIVSIHDVGQEGPNYFLVMELVSSGAVDDRLQEGKSYSPFEATRILVDACQGVAAAHQMSLVHRDIKPANLLRSADGRIKVTDFGIVKELASSSGATKTGNVVGTPYFMSPEQCEGRSVDFRSDIYALGATYYSLLTGTHPYAESKSTMQVMYAHCHQPPPNPLAVDSSIPPACNIIIQKAMAKRPQDRYQSTAEMLAELNLVLASLSSGHLLAAGAISGDRLTALLSGNQSPHSSSRRRFFIQAGSAGLALLGGAAGVAFWRNRKPDSSEEATSLVLTGEDPIRIGLLHSLSGTMASSEMQVVDAVMLAVDELNQAGGVLGRQIEVVLADGRSSEETFAKEARRLIEQEKVCTVFGGWTSACRKAMKPVFEELDHLLVYPLQYEGLESSPNIIYLGAAPNQQIIPAMDWARNVLGKKRFFLVGSDYVFPRTAHQIIKDRISQMDGEIVGEAYLPLGTQHVEAVVQQIQATQPDMIINSINGDTNTAFFRELRKQGITSEVIPTLSFSVSENELRSLDLSAVQGDYAAWNYFQSIDTPANRKFVTRLRQRLPQRVVTDPMESAYVGVKLWAQAVKDANSQEVRAIRRAFLSQRLPDAPHGPVRIDPESQHTYKTPRVGMIRNDGQFDIVWTGSQSVAPDVFPSSRTAEEWKGFLHDLYSGWGNHWSAPEQGTVLK